MSILVRTLVFAKDRKLNSNLLKTTATTTTTNRDFTKAGN